MLAPKPAPVLPTVAQIDTTLTRCSAMAAQVRAAFAVGDRPGALANLSRLSAAYYSIRRAVARLQQHNGIPTDITRRLEVMGLTLDSLRWRADRTQ